MNRPLLRLGLLLPLLIRLRQLQLLQRPRLPQPLPLRYTTYYTTIPAAAAAAAAAATTTTTTTTTTTSYPSVITRIPRSRKGCHPSATLETLRSKCTCIKQQRFKKVYGDSNYMQLPPQNIDMVNCHAGGKTCMTTYNSKCSFQKMVMERIGPSKTKTVWQKFHNAKVPFKFIIIIIIIIIIIRCLT